MAPDVFRRLQRLRLENAAVVGRMDELRARFEEIEGRHENGTAPRAIAVHHLFQTEPREAQRLAALIGLQPGGRVLEPSAGLARLIDALAPYAPREVVAVDVSAACMAELYRQARPGVTLKQRDFLSLSVEELGRFDGIVMNPPFEGRGDIRHIRHALQFLKPGAVCAAICAAGPHQERELRPQAELWEILPDRAFAAAGTGVKAALATFRAPALSAL